MAGIEIRPSRIGSAAAHTLIAAALADLGQRYGGEGDQTPVTASEFDPPAGNFVIAWQGESPIGCGGWRSTRHATVEARPEEVAELKRLYTVPRARGQGVAMLVLRALEESARQAGLRRMVLECGLRQPEALALYRRAGYARIANYGYYKDAPDCVSFGRTL